MIGILFDGEVARGRKVWLELDEAGGSLVLKEREEVLARWSLDGLRAVGDQAGHANFVLMHKEKGEARLVVSDEDLLARLETLCPDLRTREARPGQLRRALWWAGGAVAAVAAIILIIIPGLSDRLAVFIPPEREVALGKHTVENLRWGLAKRGGGEVSFCSNPEGRVALLKLGQRLATDDELPYPITLQVIDHPMPNAFAVPGGHIVLFQGLIKNATSPEEVASVLAHELGHVVARDPTRLALRSASSAGILGLLIGDFTGGAAVLLLTEQMLSARYTRDAEQAADEFAQKTLVAAGLPLEPMATFFERMAGGRPAGGDSGTLSSHLKSHPDLAERAERARAAETRQDASFEPALSAEDWQHLRQICATTLDEPVP